MKTPPGYTPSSEPGRLAILGAPLCPALLAKTWHLPHEGGDWQLRRCAPAAMLEIGEPGRQPISPQVGEMPGRAEGGAVPPASRKVLRGSSASFCGTTHNNCGNPNTSSLNPALSSLGERRPAAASAPATRSTGRRQGGFDDEVDADRKSAASAGRARRRRF
ncbi:MAG: hypothetical protein E5Y67_32425 [Mesorhizobium sp.]|nr:MAG: hypothetical protein E5Y67_32425 [Mesorhizobium sp.]